MDQGKLQSDLDDSDVLYENITCFDELSETTLKMRKSQHEPKEENLSSKFLKATETLKTQRRLLMILTTLLVLVFTFLIILTSLLFIYYFMVSSQLKQQDEEKDNLLTQIRTMNQTLNKQNANLLTKFTTLKQTLDEQKANLLSEITTTKQRLDDEKTGLLKQITGMEKTLGLSMFQYLHNTKQEILQTIQNEKPKCDSDWKAFDGSCYYIVTTKKNWTEAQDNCKSMNSDLAIINSDRKKNFIERITDNSYFWIGLIRDKKDKNEWRWVDGTYYNPPERFWMKGEPGNKGGKEDCVHMSTENKWNDVVCTDEKKSICEKK